jgi:hypothetical protein
LQCALSPLVSLAMSSDDDLLRRKPPSDPKGHPGIVPGLDAEAANKIAGEGDPPPVADRLPPAVWIGGLVLVLGFLLWVFVQ